MQSYIINGGKRLTGKIEIQSAKNSVLALLAGCVLSSGTVVIKKCPKITDVLNMLEILREMGAEISWNDDNVSIECSKIESGEISEKLAKEMRSSIFLLGSILSRFKQGRIIYPGGCDIGVRPIDLHINGLKKLGMTVEENGEQILCEGKEMHSGHIALSFPSVGATENLILASVFLKGQTVIENAAREPEIVDLQNFINKMGGCVSGAGSRTITVNGVEKLGSVEFEPIKDRIVAGTYLIGVAMAGGDIEISGVPNQNIHSLIAKMRKSTCKIKCYDDKIRMIVPRRPISVPLIETMPHPGFPTDLQAQIFAMQTISEGTSVIIENIFETRFKHASELIKMGANVKVFDKLAVIQGVLQLHGATVHAKDLRGGASLVLAGLCAKGQTVVKEIHHIERGYENFVENLSKLGADIIKIDK